MPTVGVTHNLELGGRYYMIRPASYIKRAAPIFGARFATGDPDFNNFSFWQHWAQRCFVGGMDAEVFADDAMYDEGAGVDTTEHEKVRLARDLQKGSGGGWSAGGTLTRKFFVWNNALWLVTMPALGVASHLWKYDPSTDAWVDTHTFADLTCRSIASFDGKMYFGGRKLDNSAGKVVRNDNAGLTNFSTISNPASGGTFTVTAMRQFQQKLYVAYGRWVWRLKDDESWDGNTVFYKASALSDSNFIVAFEVHLGFLYMLSQNAHVHRTDGNSTFDIWNWDGQTWGVGIKSFDGRLFIATYEYTNTAEVGVAALYQMSGSAVTQLKRWGKETESNILASLIAYDRKLFYGASNLLGIRAGFGITVYDPIEDAHSIMASNSDTSTYSRGAAPYTNNIVDDVFAFGGFLWATVRAHGVFKVAYKPRDFFTATRRYDTTPAGGSPAGENGGWFKTSTYDAGTPGVRKLWRKIVVDYSIPHTTTSIIVDYSINDGNTWTEAGVISEANGFTVGGRHRGEFWLENVQDVSLKLRFTLRSTNNTVSPTLFGFVVSYLPTPEPNWLWTFTIVMSEKQELVDGTTETNDTEEELAFLRNAFRTKEMLHFTDIDGTVWADNDNPGVIIYDIEFRHYDATTQPLEGEVVVTLLEAVETY